MPGILTDLGMMLAFFGFWLVVTPLGFATMIDPSITGWAWWVEYWSRLVAGDGIRAVWAGLVAEGLGWTLILYDRDRLRPHHSPPDSSRPTPP